MDINRDEEEKQRYRLRLGSVIFGLTATVLLIIVISIPKPEPTIPTYVNCYTILCDTAVERTYPVKYEYIPDDYDTTIYIYSGNGDKVGRLGYQATSGNYNVAIGHQAISTGNNNVMIGYKAGKVINKDTKSDCQ